MKRLFFYIALAMLMTISSNTVLASTDVETTENNESKEQYRNADEISYDELNEIYNEYLSTFPSFSDISIDNVLKYSLYI